MTVTAALLAYAILLGAFGPRLLCMKDWTQRAPRTGLLAWQASTASVLAALVLAGLTMVVPVVRAPHGLADLLSACRMMVRAHYASAPQPVGAYAGLFVVGGVLLWTGGHVAAALATAEVRRRRHADVLTMVARRRADLRALVIDHEQPLVYCLPGRRRCVVLSTGALDRLPADQMSAVLAHEHAHLSGRHDIAVNLAVALRRAFPVVPLFRAADTEIPRLVELLADDVAARHHDRVTLAAALVTVAVGRAPAAAMGAGGGTALIRVRRLLRPHQPLPKLARLTSAVGIALMITLPLALALNPAVTALLERHCPLPL